MPDDLKAPPPVGGMEAPVDIRSAAFAIDAVYTDRFIINCHNGMVRVTVAEQAGMPDTLNLRGCFIMRHAEAQQLAYMMLQMIEQQEKLAAGAQAAGHTVMQ